MDPNRLDIQLKNMRGAPRCGARTRRGSTSSDFVNATLIQIQNASRANDLALRYRPDPSSGEAVLEEAARLEANLGRSG